MIQLEIRKVLDTVGPTLDELNRNQLSRANARAITRALTTGRAAASRQFTEEYNLPSTDVKDRIITRRIGGPASYVADQGGELRIKTKGVPLFLYRARQTKKGVSVSVRRDRKVIAHSFIATMKSGHTGVFVRIKGENKRRSAATIGGLQPSGLVGRLPIEELWGMSPYQFFKARGNFDALSAVIMEAYRTNLVHEVGYAIRQAKENSKK